MWNEPCDTNPIWKISLEAYGTDLYSMLKNVEREREIL